MTANNILTAQHLVAKFCMETRVVWGWDMY